MKKKRVKSKKSSPDILVKEISYSDIISRVEAIHIEIDMLIEIAKQSQKNGQINISLNQYIGCLLLLKQHFTKIIYSDEIIKENLASALKNKISKHNKSTGRRPLGLGELNKKRKILKLFLDENPKFKKKRFQYSAFENWFLKNKISENDTFSPSYLKKNIVTLIELLYPT